MAVPFVGTASKLSVSPLEQTLAIARRKVAQLVRDPRVTSVTSRVCSRRGRSGSGEPCWDRSPLRVLSYIFGRSRHHGLLRWEGAYQDDGVKFAASHSAMGSRPELAQCGSE